MSFPIQRLDRFEWQEIRWWMVNPSDIPVHNRPLSSLSEENSQIAIILAPI